MATVKGPLFSIGASGTVGGAVVYSVWKGRPYVRQHAVPANPRSASQLSVRAMMKFLSQYWTNQSEADAAAWDPLAAASNISPFNAYVGYNQTRWGIGLFPARKPPALLGDLAAILDDFTAVAGVKSVLLTTTITTFNQNWGINIYRSLDPAMGTPRHQLVQSIPALIGGPFTWLDTGLTVGVTYYYRAKPFSWDAMAGDSFATQSAVPTA